MKIRFIFTLSLFCISMFSQKDVLHTFQTVTDDSFSVSFKSMEDDKAIIFTVGNYSNNSMVDVESFLTKVDYCGEIDVFTKVSISDYTRIMLFDGVKNNDKYTFVGTALSQVDGKSYLITVSTSLDLSVMEVIDTRKVNYLFVINTYHNSTKDVNTGLNYLVFNLSNNFTGAKEALILSYSNTSVIEYLSGLDLEDIYITEYYYNTNIKKHFIISGSIVTVLNQQFEIINSYDIYVELDDKKIYNIEYKIMYADSEKAVLVGRWGSSRQLYTYTIGFNGNEFLSGEYRSDVFPEIKSYVLRKKTNQNNKIIVSVSTDELATSKDVPNINYLWQMDESGNILKTYQIKDSYKKSMRISDIDSNGNMLAIGYEYLPERNIFAILDDDSAFVVGTQDINENEKRFKIFPNPASDNISIPNNIFTDHIQIFNYLGELIQNITINSDDDKKLKIDHLLPGQYIVIISNVNLNRYATFVKI